MNWSPDSGSLDCATLHQEYHSAALRVVDVIEAVYRRIANAENGVWISRVEKSSVLEQARQLDALLKHDAGILDKLPLFGLPFAIKDNIDLANIPTTSACPAFAYTPARSAEVVDRLIHAGALPIGKTNLDQFATGLVGTRSPYGVCRNAFNRDYISGGSSSGSAVAVAAGQVTFSLGTDTAGSGRVPAAFNNIVGLKPTFGLISTRGVAPANKTLDCVSIFALTAPDAERVALTAYGLEKEKLQPPSNKSRFRFGIPRPDALLFFGDDKAQTAFHVARERLKALGGSEVEIDFTPFAEAGKLLYGGPWLAERLSAVQSILKRNPESVYPDTLTILQRGQGIAVADVFEGLHRLKQLRVAAEAAWKDIDVLVVPTAGTIYSVDQILKDGINLNANLGYYTNFVNLLDYCAVAVPAGLCEDGLPFGISFIAPAFRDAELIQLSAEYHAIVGGKLGATPHPLAKPLTSPVPKVGPPGGKIQLAVVGAHLRGQPLNRELTNLGATFVRQTLTSHAYKLFALKDTTPPKPGLIYVGNDGGSSIEIEIWNVPSEHFGTFISGVKRPLGIGTLVLEDGTEVKGFICEPSAIPGSLDISAYGGWRRFLEEHTQSGSKIKQ